MVRIVTIRLAALGGIVVTELDVERVQTWSRTTDLSHLSIFYGILKIPAGMKKDTS
jgi:hypothetical protein